jgi:hypothetical protein
MTCLSTLRTEMYTEFKNDYNKCWYNASHNRLVYKQHQGLKLHWVVGGIRCMMSKKTGDAVYLGFDKSKTGEIKLRTNFESTNRWSHTHAWLEDDYGNVWDYTHEEDVERYRESPDSTDWKLEAGPIEGIHRSVLKEMGYELYAYPVETQKIILEKILDQDAIIPDEIEETLEMIQF